MRFSLKTLLAFMLLISLAIGAVTKLHSAADKRAQEASLLATITQHNKSKKQAIKLAIANGTSLGYDRSLDDLQAAIKQLSQLKDQLTETFNTLVAEVEVEPRENLTVEITQAQRQQSEDELLYLIKSFRTPEMVDLLRTSIESAGTDYLLVCEAQQPGARLTTFYLYAPADGQTLTIDLKDATSQGTSFPPMTDWNETPYDTIDVPLVAGKLHQFAFGVESIKRQHGFRVVFDGREIFGVTLPNSRSGSKFKRNPDFRIAVTVPNRFGGQFTNISERIPRGRWMRLSDSSFGFGGAIKKQIAIRVHLSSEGPFSIDPTKYWDTIRMLDLQWDPAAKEYRILGVKAQRVQPR